MNKRLSILVMFFLLGLPALANTNALAFQLKLNEGSGTVVRSTLDGAAYSLTNVYWEDGAPRFYAGSNGIGFLNTNINNIACTTLGLTNLEAVSFWVKPYTEDVGEHAYLGTDYYTNSGVHGFGWYVSVYYDNTYNYTVALKAGMVRINSTERRISSTKPTFGVWNHVVVTGKMHSITTTNEIYINGVRRTYTTQFSGTGEGENSVNQASFIGGNPHNPGFNGLIADVRVYHAGLTVAEISALYAAGRDLVPLASGPSQPGRSPLFNFGHFGRLGFNFK